MRCYGSRAALFAAALLALASGCTKVPVRLWTDMSEVAPIVELYNASQTRHVVEIHYEPQVARALRYASDGPDVVVARSIADASTARLFRPLDGLFGRRIDRSQFYAALLATGSRDGRQLLLPVAFNLPLVYFASDYEPAGEPIIISPAEMRERGASFDERSADRLVRLAYSPLWEPEFLYQYWRASGFEVREAADGTPSWSFDLLLGFLREAKDWIELTNGGLGVDAAFRERYLYGPLMPLVRAGRIAYGYSRSDEYLTASDERRSGLRFRWFGDGDQVAVLEDVTYAAIPQASGARSGAEEFLAWLFRLETQERIIGSSFEKRITGFGVAGGFSSLWRVNERVLPRHYPVLAGRVPPVDSLRFAPASPRHWGSLVEEVVQPWLLRELAGVPQARELDPAVRAWLLQQED